MNLDSTDMVYLVLASVPFTMLLAILIPLLPRGGVWFRTKPTREQGLVLGMLGFTFLVAVFGMRRLPFGLFMALCGSAVLFQSWGPKRWKNGRVYGAYLVPLKIRGWLRDEKQVLVRLGMGSRLLVPEVPSNRAFLAELETLIPSDS